MKDAPRHKKWSTTLKTNKKKRNVQTVIENQPVAV